MAVPAISTGAYGFPLERATRIAIAEPLGFLEAALQPSRVTFVCFDGATRELYDELMSELVG